MTNNGTTTEQAPVKAGQKKITLATLKSFIRKNSDRLFAKLSSKFDGMTDCVQPIEDSFTPIIAENALGVKGVYLVGGSRNRFWAFENEVFSGIEISNCCGRGIIAIKK